MSTRQLLWLLYVDVVSFAHLNELGSLIDLTAHGAASFLS